VIGRTLSSYRVVEKLGGGGMGQVYLARDERLGRDVALKVLPEGRLEDERARSRFRKEAQALLRLSHPHVATLFDFGSENGTDYLVMERVSGPTLAEELRRGKVAEKDVVRLGAQLARGLAAAHEAGVVHRDLKPSNLALTLDGLLKILDFGLARLERREDAGEPTATQTAPGSFAGTLPYMAPEQVRGEAADARTDVYGAGAVLYELATGRRVFEGRTGAELSAAILTEAPPPPRRTTSSLSPGLEAVILKALDKDPDLRYQSAREMLVDLERLARGATTPTLDSPTAATRTAVRRRRRWLVGAVALALLPLAAWQLRPAPTPRITNIRRIMGGLGRPPEVSWATDGVRLYYIGRRTGAPNAAALFQVPVSGGEPAEIHLPFENFRGVFGYCERESALLVGVDEAAERFRQTQGVPLWLVPVPSGAPRRVGNLTGWSAALSADGDWVAAYQTDGVVVARLDGSEARTVGGGSLAPEGRWVSWSPDGDRLRVRARGPDGSEAWMWDVPLEGGPARPVGPGARGAFTRDGRYFVLQRDEGGGDIEAIREPPRWSWRRPGPARLTAGPLLFEAPGPSPDGRRLFAWGTIERHRLLRYDAPTRRFVPHLGGAPASQVAASPDGEWLTWVRRPEGTLWRSRADGSQRLQLTAPPVVAFLPRWSPDGRRIVFTGGSVDRRFTLFVVAAEGGEPESLGGWPTGLVEGAQSPLWDPCWLDDGRSIVYSTWLPWQTGIFRMDAETRQVSRLPGSEGLQFPKCGPQGQILAMVRPITTAGSSSGFRVFWPGGTEWEDVGPIAGAAYANWARDGQSIIGLNITDQRIERRSLRTGRVEVLADVHDLRLDAVSSTQWMGLGPDDTPLVTEDLSTSDLYALDWETP
jgi:hypothetical protein